MIKDKTAVSFDGSNEQTAKLRVKCVSSADTNMWFTYTQGYSFPPWGEVRFLASVA